MAYRWRTPWLQLDAPPESGIEPAYNVFIQLLQKGAKDGLQHRKECTSLPYRPVTRMQRVTFMTKEYKLHDDGRHRWQIDLTVDDQTDLIDLLSTNETDLFTSIYTLLRPMAKVQQANYRRAGADLAEGRYRINNIVVTIKIQYDLRKSLGIL
jgi:hypothetical protein